MKWTDEIGRARYYLSQANALLAKAQEELIGIEEVTSGMAKLSKSLNMDNCEPYQGYIPDSRTALHQVSLALVNVKGSLVAAGRIKDANAAEEIRGEIIRWFDE